MNRDVLTLLGGHIVNSKHQCMCACVCAIHTYMYVCFQRRWIRACVCLFVLRTVGRRYSTLEHAHQDSMPTTYGNFSIDHTSYRAKFTAWRWRASITIALAKQPESLMGVCVCARGYIVRMYLCRLFWKFVDGAVFSVHASPANRSAANRDSWWTVSMTICVCENDWKIYIRISVQMTTNYDANHAHSQNHSQMMGISSKRIQFRCVSLQQFHFIIRIALRMVNGLVVE